MTNKKKFTIVLAIMLVFTFCFSMQAKALSLTTTLSQAALVALGFKFCVVIFALAGILGVVLYADEIEMVVNDFATYVGDYNFGETAEQTLMNFGMRVQEATSQGQLLNFFELELMNLYSFLETYDKVELKTAVTDFTFNPYTEIRLDPLDTTKEFVVSGSSINQSKYYGQSVYNGWEYNNYNVFDLNSLSLTVMCFMKQGVYKLSVHSSFDYDNTFFEEEFVIAEQTIDVGTDNTYIQFDTYVDDLGYAIPYEICDIATDSVVKTGTLEGTFSVPLSRAIAVPWTIPQDVTMEGAYAIPIPASVTSVEGLSTMDLPTYASSVNSIPRSELLTLTAVNTIPVVETDVPGTGIIDTIKGWLLGILEAILAVLKQILEAILSIPSYLQRLLDNAKSIPQILSNILTAVKEGFSTTYEKLFEIDDSVEIDLSVFEGISLVDKFPFCIPFDLLDAVKMFAVGENRNISINLDTQYFTINEKLDLNNFSLAIGFFRYIVVFAFVLFLITKTKDFISW